MERKLRETDRQTETDSESKRQTERERETERETETESEREADRQRDGERETDTDTDRERELHCSQLFTWSETEGGSDRVDGRSAKGGDSRVQHTSLQDHYNVKQ